MCIRDSRYNVRLREPDASVTAQSPNFDIAQHGGDVILAEPQMCIRDSR